MATIKKKDFYGSVSFTGRAYFTTKGKNTEDAEESVFNDIEGITLHLKDSSNVEISEIEWDLIKKEARGNCKEAYIDDFEIIEDK